MRKLLTKPKGAAPGGAPVDALMGESLSGKRIGVAGGAGFVGSHLCDRLIAEKPSRLVVIDDFSLGKERNLSAVKGLETVRIYHADAADYESMRSILRKERLDVVFNLAVIPLPKSLELPRETVRTNIEIATTFCELLRREFFGQLVHCSSSEAYGSALYVPMDENHPHQPLTPYAASKIAGDHIAFSYFKTFRLDISIVRPFNTYGPRQNEGSYAGVIPLTIRRIMNGKAPVIFGTGLQTRDYTYVTDIVEGIIGVFKTRATRGRVVNVASGREVTIKHIIETIASLMEYTGEITYEPARPGDVLRHRGDISLAKKLFNYRPKVTLPEGLRMTTSWYRKDASPRSASSR